MKKILLLISFIFMFGLSYSQEPGVQLRKFDEKKWKEIVGSQDYEEDPREERKRSSPKDPGWTLPGLSPQLLKAIAFALVFALFVFILYYVSRNATFGRSNPKTKPVDASAPVENIEELDIEALLRDALSRGDLRLAVRVHYLLLLKKLNEAGLITWKKDKTNRDYLSELYGQNACYDDVRVLTLAYELVWYGERSVSSESFQTLSGNFESVNRAITQQPTT